MILNCRRDNSLKPAYTRSVCFWI